jgi:hypothetical protein
VKQAIGAMFIVVVRIGRERARGCLGAQCAAGFRCPRHAHEAMRSTGNNPFFLAWHGAAMETMIFVDVLEIAGNLKLCYKVAKLVRTRPDGPGHRFGFKNFFPLKWLARKLFKGKSLQ